MGATNGHSFQGLFSTILFPSNKSKLLLILSCLVNFVERNNLSLSVVSHDFTINPRIWSANYSYLLAPDHYNENEHKHHFGKDWAQKLNMPFKFE